MVAVEDVVAAEDTKVVVATEAATTTTTTTTTPSTMEIKEAVSTTIKVFPIIFTTKAATTEVVADTKAITFKDPLKAKVREESIFTQEGGMISTILRWALEPQGLPTK